MTQTIEYKPELFDWLAEKAANLPFSQFGEDGIIRAIFERIGVTTRFCIEVGAADGLFFSNTRRLIEDGWDALLVEGDKDTYDRLVQNLARYDNVDAVHQMIKPTGPNSLDELAKYYKPRVQPDLMVIDVDGQDAYILNAIEYLKPRVLLVEYDPDAHLMYMPMLNGIGQAGLQVMQTIAMARGFLPIVRTQVNLICVQRSLAGMLAQIS